MPKMIATSCPTNLETQKSKRNALSTGVPFTTIPDYFLAHVMPNLSPTELRVMFYIYLHTLGYGKLADNISYDQFINGIVTRDGKRLDQGAGVSRRALPAALAGLENKKLIIRVYNGYAPVTYRLAPIALGDATNSPTTTTGDKDEGAKESQETQPVSLESPTQNAVPGQDLPVLATNAGQDLPLTIESRFKHENHDRGSNQAVVMTKPTVAAEVILQTKEKEKAAAIGLLTDQVSGISKSDACRLVAVALEQHSRDLAYIQRLVTYVSTTPGLANPAAVLTSLIRSDADRTTADARPARKKRPASRSNQPPINFAKYSRLASSSSSSAVELPTPSLPAEPLPAPDLALPPTTDQPDSAKPAYSQLKWALADYDPQVAARLRGLAVDGATLQVSFYGAGDYDLSGWLGIVQIFYPAVRQIELQSPQGVRMKGEG